MPGSHRSIRMALALVVAVEQPHGARAVPERERVGLVLGLAVRVDQLQHRRRPVGEPRPHGVSGRALWVRLAQREPPPPRALGGRGRYSRDLIAHRSGNAWRPIVVSR